MRTATSRLTLIVLCVTNLVFFVEGQLSVDTAAQPIPRLEIAKPIERELKGGEGASFELVLKANQFLNLIVDQRGIDVEVTLLGPDDKPLVKVDSPNGNQGPEQITVIAVNGGEYTLRVQSLEKDAAAGRYEVIVESFRDSTAKDRDRIVALKEFTKALDLEQRRDEVSVRQAISIYVTAAQLLHAAEDLAMEAEAYNNIGLLHHELGEDDKALEPLSQSLSLNRSIKRRLGEIENLINLGAAYDNLGEAQRALDLNSQAIRVSSGDYPNSEATALNNIGKIYTLLGDYPKAIDNLNRAAEINHNDLMSHYPLMSLGVVYSAMGDKPKAIETYKKALEVNRALNDLRGQAVMLNNIGRVYIELKDHPNALLFLNEALELRRKTGDRNGEVSTLNNLGVLNDSIGKRQEGRALVMQALDISRSTGDKFSEARTLRTLTRIEQENNNLVEAKGYIEAAIVIMESFRTKLASRQSRTSFLAAIQDYYEANTNILMLLHVQSPSEGYDVKALEVSERAKARALTETLNEAGIDFRRGINPKLLEREKDLQKQLNEKAELQTRAMNDKGSAASLQAEITALTNEYNDVQTEIRRNSDRFSSLNEPALLTAGELQNEMLGADGVLLEYSLGDGGSYLWVVTSTSVSSYMLPKRAEIETAARRVYELLNDGKRWASSNAAIKAEYEKAAAQLSDVILAPAVGQIKGKRLLIVADGALQYIPFGALPYPVSPSETLASVERSSTEGTARKKLIETNEIVGVPSVSVLRALRRVTENRVPSSKTLAVFADPVFTAVDERVKAGTTRVINGKGGALSARTPLERAYNMDIDSDRPSKISRLPFTRREAESIFGNAPRSMSLRALDFEASKDNVVGGDLSQYRIIHFATHGILHSEHPELSGVVLSLVNEKGQPINGFLRLNEIYNLKLNADLVVLSACQTALGKEIRGEGLIGLTRGFMYAGSPRVVASLWKVDDVATADMMKIFYQKMLKEKMRPAAALREAKIDMMKQKRWNSPYYWAAFELQGEWR